MRTTARLISPIRLDIQHGYYFGEPRQRGSHLFYRMPWQGRPLVNIQPVRGMAKPYQVRQVLKAIDKLEEMYG